MLEIDKQLQKLSEQSREDLIRQWVDTFNKPAPQHASLPMMRRILAYELQAKAYGDVTPSTNRRIKSILVPGPKSNHKAQAIGTRLVREWNGVTHTVLVIEDGYEWQDRSYRSLSAIAREITGAHWSGPRFFQVNKKERSNDK